MVSKILPSVGFGRFCKKNRGFLLGFGSHNKCIVNVEVASDAVILSHVVLYLLTMHIDIVLVSFENDVLGLTLVDAKVLLDNIH